MNLHHVASSNKLLESYPYDDYSPSYKDSYTEQFFTFDFYTDSTCTIATSFVPSNMTDFNEFECAYINDDEPSFECIACDDVETNGNEMTFTLVVGNTQCVQPNLPLSDCLGFPSDGGTYFAQFSATCTDEAVDSFNSSVCPSGADNSDNLGDLVGYLVL